MTTLDLSRPTLIWELSKLMPEIVEMEKAAAAEVTVGPKPRVYTWKPRAIDLPAVWNNLVIEAPHRQMDTARQRDVFTVVSTWAIRHTDVEEEMARIAHYVDVFRSVVDPSLYVKAPMGAKWAERVGVRLTEIPLGQDLTALAVEFPINFQLDRVYSPA